MIRLDDIRHIYFIGIGGIGMSALARYFAHRGAQVSGYDRTETALTKQLQAEGIRICYDDDLSLLDREAQLVVYTPAVPASHAQLQWYRQNGYEVVKRSRVLGIITEGSFNVCVAGTHGKTSISTMIAHLLRHGGPGCNAFLGGVSANYGTNFWASDNPLCVVEADEYDRSFLQLSPDVAVVSSMDADHLDIYGQAESVEEAFVEFARRLKPRGILLRKHGLDKLQEALPPRQLTYCIEEEAGNSHDRPDVFVRNLQVAEGGYRFDAVVSGEAIDGIELLIGGTHNVENMLAAIAVARMLQMTPDDIRRSVAAFRGVRRRFEYILPPGSPTVFIDDYAHHPTELRALLSSVKQLFPGRKCTVIFQPHLFSRTLDFADGFADALSLADEAVLLPIYPARELPIAGVSSAMIAEKMTNAVLLNKEELRTWVLRHPAEVLVTAGAGDIDAWVPQIAEWIRNKQTDSTAT